jgi:hypothetical protein
MEGHRHRNTAETANLISGKRLMRPLLSCSMALLLATLTTEAWAQSGTGNADESDAQGSMPLSAAIADVRRSPFHTSELLVPLRSSMSRHLWAPLATGSRGSPIRPAPNDSTFSTGRVFLMSWGAAALSDIVGVYFLVCTEGGSGCFAEAGAGVAAAIATPVLGTAGGATLAGARFLPALAGSAAGFGVALLHFVRPIVDPNDNFVLYIAIPSIVQAGITTLVASRWKA